MHLPPALDRVRTTLLGPPPDGAVKVPAITALFWSLKLATTAMGEAASDWSVHTINPPIAVLIGASLFALAIVVQLRRVRFEAPAYWFAVSMVGVFGTMVADVLHVGLGVPYAISTIGCAVILTAIFATWRAREGTLSIHSITTRRRELFYWAAVVATFAFGTAIGDLSAVTLHLGYFGSIWLYAAAIAIPGLYFFRTRAHGVACFWTAYVLTRPLGASIADWVGVNHHRGGLNLGPGVVALVGIALICSMVLIAVRRDEDPHR
jgi:uncharacterized membrane-anchored protein